MKRELEAKLTVQGEDVLLHALLDGDTLSVKSGGETRLFRARVSDEGEVTLLAQDGRIVHGFVSRDLVVSLRGRTTAVARVQGKRAARSAEETALEAPMPGTCRDVFVAAGARVEKNQRLLLVEAMKMEHEIRSPRQGVVRSVRVKKGDAVSPGSPLVELET